MSPDLTISGPLELEVRASDPRLTGLAVEYWVDATYKDRDKDPGDRVSRPGQGELSAVFISITITNDESAWTGTMSPTSFASDFRGGAVDAVGLDARNDGSYERQGAAVLTGSGAYGGYTAFLDFPPSQDDEMAPHASAFEAVIVNRQVPQLHTAEQMASVFDAAGTNSWITSE
jgi:hypothetical protein